MDRLLQLLFDEPWIAIVVFFWIVGAIGNVLKTAKKREQAARRGPPPPVGTTSPSGRTPDSERVAREMRRILGLEPDVEAVPQRRPAAEAAHKAAPASRPAQPQRRGIERAPLSPPKRQERIDSHVGESMSHRTSASSADFGSLGGRVHQQLRRVDGGGRYALTDLKRIFVLAEVLGPPVALRRQDERLI